MDIRLISGSSYSRSICENDIRASISAKREKDVTSLWGKIADWFLGTHKEAAKVALFRLARADTAAQQLTSFSELKQYVVPARKDSLTWQLSDTGSVFRIGGVDIPCRVLSETAIVDPSAFDLADTCRLLCSMNYAGHNVLCELHRFAAGTQSQRSADWVLKAQRRFLNQTPNLLEALKLIGLHQHDAQGIYQTVERMVLNMTGSQNFAVQAARNAQSLILASNAEHTFNTLGTSGSSKLSRPEGLKSALSSIKQGVQSERPARAVRFEAATQVVVFDSQHDAPQFVATSSRETIPLLSARPMASQKTTAPFLTADALTPHARNIHGTSARAAMAMLRPSTVRAGELSDTAQVDREGVLDVNGRLGPQERDFRALVGKLYGIVESVWPRQFAPVSIRDTVRERIISEEKISQVARALVDLAQKYNMPPAVQESIQANMALASSPSTRGGRDKELQSAIKAVIPQWGNLSLKGTYGYGHSFSDNDILKVHGEHSGAQVRGESVDGYQFSIIDHKAVMLQPATRGCTAAVTAMLLQDAGAHIDVQDMRPRNLGNTEVMVSNFKKAGFGTQVSTNHTLDELKQAIALFGPAILSVNSGMGGHVIVVDAIEEDRVTLRDPAHGWMIDVRPSALKFQAKCLHLAKNS